MKKLAFLIIVLLSINSLLAQIQFPSEIKGNWLKTSDSIEWYCSFQPHFAVMDNQFWHYTDITQNKNSYLINLYNELVFRKISIIMLDSSTLILEENGIKILCTNRKATNPDFLHYDILKFENLNLVDDSATITGFIEDYNTTVFSSEGKISYQSALTVLEEENATIPFTIHPDGRFQVRFRMFNPQPVYLIIEGSRQTRIFAQPGQTGFICFNKNLLWLTENPDRWQEMNDWDVNHYMGKTGLLSEELLLLEAFCNSLEEIVFNSRKDDELSQMSYQDWRKGAYLKHVVSMDSLIRVLHNSEKARQVILTRMELILIHDLFNLQFKKAIFSEQYFSGMPFIDTDNSIILVSDYCYQYINSLNNIYPVQPLKGCYDAYDKQMRHLSVTVSDSTDLLIINGWLAEYENYSWPCLKMGNEVPDSILLKDFRKYHSSLIMLRKYDYLLKSLNTGIGITFLDKMLGDFNGDFTGQLLCTYSLMHKQKYKMLDTAMIHWVFINITDSVMLKLIVENQAGLAAFQQAFTDFSPGTFIIDSIPESGSADELFSGIINRFKGKVIYIDFWADWCSPCRAEFPHAEVLKKEYEGKDVVFLYIGMSCEYENWTNMIKQKQIKGYHYWLNKEQGRLLSEKFQITGIPYFLLVDKNSNPSNEAAPRPSSKTEIREQIDRLLSY
jgi:thiol-disulfide isomerase/thioredoxin